jgi:hypothetical protein
VGNPVILLLSRNIPSNGILFTTDDGTDPEIKFELKMMKSKKAKSDSLNKLDGMVPVSELNPKSIRRKRLCVLKGGTCPDSPAREPGGVDSSR